MSNLQAFIIEVVEQQYIYKSLQGTEKEAN